MIISNNTHTDDTDKMSSSSILKGGKLKPGIYKIQNLVGQTFVEMKEDARQLCCRPAMVLSGGDGLVRSPGFLFAKDIDA